MQFLHCVLPSLVTFLTIAILSIYCRAVHILPNRFLGVVGEHEELPIEALSLTHDGQYLVSCSHDQCVKFWYVGDLKDIKVDTSKKAKSSVKRKPIGKAAKKNDFFAGLVDDEPEGDGAVDSDSCNDSSDDDSN